MKKIFLFLIIGFQISNAQLFRSLTNVGTTVAQFLKIGTDARTLALGSGGVALDGSITSLYWNPGGIATIKNSGSTNLTHAEWLADINYNFASTILNLNEIGVVGLSFTSLNVPEEIVRTESNPFGDGRRWSANSFSLGLTYARSLTDRFSIGGTAKYIYEGIWNEKSSAFAFDIGTFYKSEFNDIKIGASISNFGSKMKLTGSDINFTSNPSGEISQGPQNIGSEYSVDEFQIPLTFRVGATMNIFSSNQIKSTLIVDAVHPNDNAEYVNIGIESNFEETFYLRVGKKAQFLPNSEQGLTYGFGISYPMSTQTNFKIDYALANYGRLEKVQFVSIIIEY